jgi:hypothetical protein
MFLFTTTMKTVQQKLRWLGAVTSIALLALLLSSCSKHNDNIVQAPTANLEVIDVSPTAPTLDFYLDGTKVNSGPISYTGGLQYFVCYAGNRHAAFYQSGSTTVVASDTVNLQASNAYTLILSNLPSKPDLTLIRDSIFMPSTGGATLRLINASPDAGAVDFGLKGGPVLGSNIIYRKYSAFIPVTFTSAHSDTLQIYRTGTSTVLQKIPVSLQAGGVYTAYLYGFTGQTSTDQKLGLGVVENTYFY